MCREQQLKVLSDVIWLLQNWYWFTLDELGPYHYAISNVEKMAQRVREGLLLADQIQAIRAERGM